ncbi:MAG: EthD family reductase [Epsilonproteobacteria bacterium]|nr:MAG: EthD family reductase [Campylobacterota bacterium]RLA68136.1 MAG: EthD family reductase [Campylobacterota bacterium]
MHKLVVTYKNPEDPESFDKYYQEVHTPLAHKVPGLKELRVNKIFGTPAGASDIYLIAEMCFEDKDAFKNAMKSSEMMDCGKDLDNFAKGLANLFFAVEHTA